MPPDRNTRPLPADAPIGDRLRSLRRDAHLTQDQLAERADKSRDVIAKLEQGRRQSARLSTLSALADALDVDLSDLTGRRPRLAHGDDGPAIVAIRDALTRIDHLPGIDPADTGDPTGVAELRGTIAAGWRRYWSGDFEGLAGALPALIGEARLCARTAGPAAAGSLAQAYQLAACLLTQVGRDDLGLVAAERAMRAAETGDDEHQWATVTGTASWVMLHQGRFDEAERVATDVATRIEPSFSAPAHHIATYGNLLVTALAPRAAAERDVSDLIATALAAGERLGRRVDVYETAFGPTSARMQAAHAWSVMREPGRALDVARHLDRSDLKGISVGAHLLDVGRSHLDARHHKAATATMREARNASGAVWFRHQPIARAVVEDLAERERRLTPDLRSLMRSLDMQ
ncbi:MAG TPA: helix-turn-helix transcriptional regulator [Streptosporangiaceae bacterium]|jgi:transcriptional regulator with XRE-family HTH domain